jgi:hypothetical protein
VALNFSGERTKVTDLDACPELVELGGWEYQLGLWELNGGAEAGIENELVALSVCRRNQPVVLSRLAFYLSEVRFVGSGVRPASPGTIDVAVKALFPGGTSPIGDWLRITIPSWESTGRIVTACGVLCDGFAIYYRWPSDVEQIPVSQRWLLVGCVDREPGCVPVRVSGDFG